MFDEELRLENRQLTEDVDVLNRYISYLLEAISPDNDPTELLEEIEWITNHRNLVIDRATHGY